MNSKIKNILYNYQQSFSDKVYPEENDDIDIIMDVFKITPELKRENKQYWGRELGMVWELTVKEVFKDKISSYGDAIRIGNQEPCDCVIDNLAIDTKYRIGSGDSGTLKRLKKNAELLRNQGYQPVLLILREDNLPAALSACQKGGWTILIGEESFRFIEKYTNIQIKEVINELGDEFYINRIVNKEA